MKALRIIAMLLILGLSQEIFSQEIEIDLTFTCDTVIFPFESIETFSELTMKGDIKLEEDTSLIRVILEDETGLQYMIFEAYPLICPTLEFSIENHCDETCFLDQVNPYSIIIQITEATLDLSSFNYTSDPKENCVEERYKAKRARDAEKIETMNQLIPAFDMHWTAGDNGLIAKYYDQKRQLFGDGYNLLGYEYYYDGVFEFLGHGIYRKVDPEIAWEFDWRTRHGINNPASDYWDGNAEKAGWLTGAKDQGTCGSCWAFSAAGVTEAIANLYAARPIDYDLSEQDLLCNSGGGNCQDGSTDPCTVLVYIKDTGVITEDCYHYDTLKYDTTCETILPCPNPDPIIKISDTIYFNTSEEKDFDNIRKELINRGPLKMTYHVSKTSHAVVLSGFEFNIEDSTLTWIIKDSHGNEDLNKGFRYIDLEYFSYAVAVIPPIFKNDTALIVSCHDYDLDGYCFWGIGDKPESCDSCDCSELEDCDDNNPYVGGYDENFNCSCIFEMDSLTHFIIADTSWIDSTFVNYDIVIDSGACLTIRSYVAFAPQAGIVVKPGAELILDSAYLTKACSGLWEGIEVWGSDTTQNFKEYFGQVILTNNSIVEFARIGIANYCRICDYNFMQSGGIINAENSIFRNNETDVQFAPFKNLLYGHELSYLGIFENCRFITTVGLYPICDPKAHVDMKDVKGVRFYGCIFENELGLSAIPYSKRGKGISSIDAQFHLWKYCNNPNILPCNDWTICEFNGLEYGVKAINSISVRTLNIQGVEFENNLVGISLSGIDNASVLTNDFKCPIKTTGALVDQFKGGLFMENCTGFHIEGNYFHSTSGMEAGFSPTFGIGVKNSGPDDNEIYNNRFEKIEAAIYCIGENRGRESGLCLKCNEMSQDTNDIIVVQEENPPIGAEQGIHVFQGSPDDTTSITAPAGNTFTNLNGIPADYDNIENFNYFNSGEDIYYSHHISDFDIMTPSDSNYTYETILLINTHIPFDKSNACPSRLGGGQLKSYSSPRENIIEADYKIALLKNQLYTLVDGGNTEELNFDVLTSLPDEGLEIRQQLLSESPYLSDTVIKQAIYKEDVLPNAMIRDIMEANPQSAKNDDLLQALDDRFELMPDYMMIQVMEGKNYFGAKELLEADIQSWQQLRSKAKQELIRQFLLDTSIVNPIDSLIDFLDTENDQKSKFELAFAYWNKQDTANAMLTLNSIPSLFTLSDNQNIVYQQYIDFFEILQQIEDSHLRACDLDSSTVQDLFNLMENGCADIAAHARGLLVNGGFLDYTEYVNLPVYTKFSGPQYYSVDISAEKSQQDYLKIFPNPSGDFIIAYYEIELKYQSGMITINNTNGNLLRKYNVNQAENQIVLDIKDLPNGIYIIGLHADNQLMEIEKLSKGRY